MAFSNSFLLNAIFAVTALFLCFPDNSGASHEEQNGSNPSSIPLAFKDIDFAHAHRVYLDMAIREHRNALARLSTSTADAIVLTSIMLSVIAVSRNPDPDQSVYKPPVQWLSISSAIKDVFQAAMAIPLTENNTLTKSLVTPPEEGDYPEPNFSNTREFYSPAYLTPFRHILDFDDPDDLDPASPDVSAAYADSLALVGSIYAAIERGDPQRQLSRRMISFAPLAPRTLVALVAEGRPRALVIIAHFFALTKRLDHHYWWLRGAAEREVYGIRSLVPKTWAWALKWPVEMIEREHASES